MSAMDESEACLARADRTEQRLEAKVVVLFKPTGAAPLLKQPKCKVSRDCLFLELVAHLRKLLRSQDVYVYLNQAFTPKFDERVGRLFDWYKGDGQNMLVVHYAVQAAYG
jgi:ubiquitin-like protein ATG12